jgi:hypothetical protein
MELGVFDIYFATLVGMAMHPGYSRDNVTQPTLEDCAEKAQAMIAIRHKYVQDDEFQMGEL